MTAKSERTTFNFEHINEIYTYYQKIFTILPTMTPLTFESANIRFFNREVAKAPGMIVKKVRNMFMKHKIENSTFWCTVNNRLNLV